MARKGNERIRFDPTKQFPLTDKLLTGIYILQLPWIFFAVIEAESRMAFALLLGATVAAIVGGEKLAELLGGYVSRHVLNGKPFNNPLGVTGSGKLSKNMKKFKAQFWQLLIHASLAILETVVLSQVTVINGADLFSDPVAANRDAPGMQANPPLLRTLYQIQLAVWTMTAFFHVWINEKQSDYLVMMGHHVATIGLVGVSYQMGCMRFGLTILWIHDVSDVPIDLLKLFNYLKLENKAGMFISEINYVCVMVSWLYLRLFVFPLQVVYRTAFAGTRACHIASGYSPGMSWIDPLSEAQYKEFGQNWVAMFGHNGGFGYSLGCAIACVLLVLLLSMHIYWYMLLCRIMYGVITTGDAHETGRQTYEGDSDDDKGDSDVDAGDKRL